MRRQAVSLLAVVAVCTMARASLADHYYVPSESMEPTVHVGAQDFAVLYSRATSSKVYFSKAIPG